MYLVEIVYWNILTSELLVSTHIVRDYLRCKSKSGFQNFWVILPFQNFGSFCQELGILGKALPTPLPPLPHLPPVNHETNKRLQVGHT